MDGAILLHDKVGEKATTQFGGLVKRSAVVNVPRGELLVPVRGDDIVPRYDGEKPHNYRVKKKETITMYCDPDDDVAPLGNYEFLLLEGIQSRSTRFEVFLSGDRLDWGQTLKPGSDVYVIVPGTASSSAAVPTQGAPRAAAKVRYVGGTGTEPGIVFGVEITEKKYHGCGTTEGTLHGTLHGTRYFHCRDNCGLLLPLDKLSPNREGNTFSKAPPGGQEYGASKALNKRPLSEQGVEIGEMNTRSKTRNDSTPQQRPLNFALGDKVVVYNKKGIAIHGTVRWVGGKTAARDFKYLIVGIETQVRVRPDEFEYSHPGMTHLFTAKDKRCQLFVSQSVVFGLEQAVEVKGRHQNSPAGKLSPSENKAALAKAIGITEEELLAHVAEEEEVFKEAAVQIGKQQAKTAIPNADPQPSPQQKGQFDTHPKSPHTSMQTTLHQIAQQLSKEANEYEQKLQEYQQQVQKLETREQQMNTEMETLHKRNDQQNSVIEELSEENRSLRERLLKEIQESEKFRQHMISETLELQYQMHAKTTQLQEEVAHKTVEAEALEQQLVEQTGALQQQLDEKTLELNHLQQQLDAKTQESTQLQEEVAQSRQDSTQLRNQVEQLRQESAQHQQQLREKDDENQQIQARIDTAIAYLRGSPLTSQVGFDAIELWEVPREELQVSNTMLGTGAWGYVTEGKFRSQKVAVKCLHQGILSQYSTNQVRREISIMAQVRHPNLVLLIAAVLDARTGPMIITELLSTSLRSAYENDRLLEHSKLPVLRDVASALNYLHSHRRPILHRDVSSANILLESMPNNAWKAKLSDFGSANLVRLATTPGEGAIVYAAPEVRTDVRGPQTPKVDVYSFGVLTCEVITTQFPDPDRLQDMVQQVGQSSPIVHEMITNCTKHHPNERPTMHDILNALDALIS